MTPAAAGRRFLGKASRLAREAPACLARTAARGVEIGKRQSQGGQSLADLARAGHPYAVRAPQPAFDAAIINYHSGDFLRGFAPAPVRAFDGGLRSGVVNNSAVAGYLLGRDRPRSRMVRRPVDDVVTETLRPVYLAAIRTAVQRSVTR